MLVTLKVSQSTIQNLLSLNQEGILETWVEDNDHSSFNPDQRLDFNVEARTVTYTGQRCPLWQDGLASLLGEAMTGLKPGTREHHIAVDKAFQDAEVLEYQTSDSRLTWWETLEPYLSTRAPLVEAVAEAVRLAKREGWESPRTALAHFGPRMESIVRAATLDPTLANAEFDRETLGYGRALKAACTGVASW
jgi:hypothetical protein